MKLFNVVARRIALVASLILTVWSVGFYFIITGEINDEVDDSLENYAEMIIIRFVRNEELPAASNGSNNQFFLHEISAEEASRVSHIRYEDRDVFIKEKDETEPARVLTYIFNDDAGKFYELEVSTPYIDKTDLRHAILFWIVVLFVSILIALVVLNMWTIHRSFSPLRKLLRWLDNYRLGNQNEPLHNPTNIEEFQTMNKVVGESILRNEEAYQQQKLFVGNASHEMQTPLAVCSNRLEMLLEEGNLSEHQMEEIIKTRQTIQHLSSINRSLLLLVKIENQQFSDMQHIAFDTIVGQLLPDYETIYSSKNITITQNIVSPFIVEIDEALAHTLIHNLLKNAFVHNCADGTIHIESDNNCFTIENYGIPSPLDKNKIFDCFYHSSSNSQSTGLGLSIAKAICDRYQIEINYTFVNSHHVFTLKRLSN